MSTPPAVDVLRQRLKSYLAFLRQKLLVGGFDLDRLAQLRRLSDVRVRQFAVGKERITSADIAALLLDLKAGRFDEAAVAAGLLQAGHLALPIPGLGEEMGFIVEACLSHQLLGAEQSAGFLKAFVAQNGAAPDLTSAEKRATPAAEGQLAPLPPAVARILGSVNDLWSMPPVAYRVLHLLKIPDTPIESVIREIEKEPALAAMCLKVVNTAYYGMGSRIASIKLAIVMLGYSVTRQIVAVSALATRLGRRHEELPFDFSEFWSHSLWVAHAASLFAKAAKKGQPDDSFSAGLVHDIGKLVEYQYLRGPMKQVAKLVEGGLPYLDAEQQVLGVGHAEIGACLCERWLLPPLVVESVRHHLDSRETLEEIQVPREALVVNGLCKLSRSTISSEEGAAWAEFLKIPIDRLDKIREQASDLTKACLGEVFSFA